MLHFDKEESTFCLCPEILGVWGEFYGGVLFNLREEVSRHHNIAIGKSMDDCKKQQKKAE